MGHKYKDTINEIISDVFSSTAFIFPEPADLSDGIDLDKQDMIAAELVYKGHREGILTLIVPLDLCTELSDNMLGEEVTENEDMENKLDAIKEMLNIIAGQLLTQLHGDEAVFNLTELIARKLYQNDIFELIENQDYVCSIADENIIILVLSELRLENECQSTYS